LDPYLMAKAASAVAAVLSAADPFAARQFKDGDQDFQSVAASVESDFETSLGECSRTEFVTADDAFGRMATAFALNDVAVSTVGVSNAAATVSEDALPSVFSEPGAPERYVKEVEQVASATGASVKSLDPLEVAPLSGTGALNWFSVMEEDLTALEGPLACNTTYF